MWTELTDEPEFTVPSLRARNVPRSVNLTGVSLFLSFLAARFGFGRKNLA